MMVSLFYVEQLILQNFSYMEPLSPTSKAKTSNGHYAMGSFFAFVTR